MNVFFTSDHHFSHANVIKYSNRPFSSVDEMDEAMIQRWNEIVSINDIIYHLGDFTLGNDVYKYYKRLNGQIVFCTPAFHHDAGWIEISGHALDIQPTLCKHTKDAWIFMFHYPVAVWDRKHYGSWHLHGHIHNKEFVLPGFAMNVNVEFHNYYPVSYEEVKQHMIKLGWTPDWREFSESS